jgi:uncharacterized membrane protein (DUF4010 family)
VDPDTYLRPGLALAIGLLIGLQRERVKEGPAGIRTFALIALAGYLIGVVGAGLGDWVVCGGVVFLAAILVTGNVLDARRNAEHGAGATTEVAALLVFTIGIYLAEPENARGPAVLFAGVTALLLHYKTPLHRFVRGLGPEDVRAIMQFVLITLVVLPVLPNQTYGPFGVFNPFKAWLMVVLIVGIGLGGYLAYHLAGTRVGTLLSGILGGLVSSTATTVTASRFARHEESRVTAAAIIVLLASSISVLRILVEVAVVDPHDLRETAPPLACFFLAFLLFTLLLYWRRSAEVLHLDPPGNPAGLRPALFFGLLFVVVLFGGAAARHYLGDAGLYGIAVASGLTDIDAITLSTADLMRTGSLDPSTGWRVILVATLANLVFKGAIVAVTGGRGLFFRVLPVYGAALLTGLGLFFLWP